LELGGSWRSEANCQSRVGLELWPDNLV